MCFASAQSEMQTLQNEFMKYSQRGRQRDVEVHSDAFYLLVLLLKDVWGLLKLMFSYTLDESSFVILH